MDAKLAALTTRLAALEKQHTEDVGSLRESLHAANARIHSLEARIGVRKKEKHFQARLQELFPDGKSLRIPDVGVTDLTTRDAHMEIKAWHKYHEVPGQLAKYNQAAPRPNLRAYFFGPPPSGTRLASICDLMATHNIEMWSFDGNDDPYAHLPTPRFHPLEDYVEENLQPQEGAYMDWVILSADVKSWAKSKGGDTGKVVAAWKREELMKELERSGVVYRPTKVKDSETGRLVNWLGVTGWRFSDTRKPLRKSVPSRLEISGH
jgi:hypothetical protein